MKTAVMKIAGRGLPACALVPMLVCAPASGLAISAPSEAEARPAAIRAGVRLAQGDATDAVRVARGLPDTPIRLRVEILGEAQDYRFALLRGLPANARLTVGFAIKQSWFVAARDVPQIQLVAPPHYNGSFGLEVLFFRDSGEPPRGRMLIPVLIGADQEEPNRQFTAKVTPSLPLPPPAAIFTPSQEASLLGRATALTEQGDIASARLIYEDLAARGSAKGALAMGQSWDPDYLNTIFVPGLKPNPDIARLWYLRALDMGNSDAQSRLIRLSAHGWPQ